MPRPARSILRPRIGLDSFLRRRRTMRVAGGALGLLIAIALIVADRQGWLLHESSEWSTYHGRSFRVVRVIDGDTLDIDIPDRQRPHTRVRFWGIDAPETAKPQEGKAAQPFADDAWSLTRRLCDSGSVRVLLDRRQPRDRFDRLLAYLVLPDGTVVNEALLLEGMAKYDARFPHQQLERYELLEKQARFDKKGMWAK